MLPQRTEEGSKWEVKVIIACHYGTYQQEPCVEARPPVESLFATSLCYQVTWESI